MEDATPAGIDPTVASTARMYDYYLGGKDHFPADRERAEEVLAAAPEVRNLARENRAFLGRAVRFLTGEAGIRQFIDIGTGIPTAGNVHQIAHRVVPDAQIVYVDNDPIVLAHARALLEDSDATDTVTVVEGDMRQPGEILRDPRLRARIDFEQPVAVLFASVLHFVTDEQDPQTIVRSFRDVLPPGSYLALSHIVEEEGQTTRSAAAQAYNKATSTATLRSRSQIRRLFDGFDLIEPGLVYLPQWRPDDPAAVNDPERVWMLAGVGHKQD